MISGFLNSGRGSLRWRAVANGVRAALLLLLAAWPGYAWAQADAALAPTPPMGWNSWDSYGLRVGEQEFRENASVLARRLLPAGYRYAVVDEGWYLQNPEDRPHPGLLRYELDANGRYLPVPARFPSAVSHGNNAGFTALAASVHAQGLLFGIHVIRGIPKVSVERNLPIEGSAFTARDAADQTDTCPWDPTSWGVRDDAAGQAWYDALLRQYAGWGVDFLKVDCISNNPYRISEIRQIHRALERAGRPMVLSLSPGPTALSHAGELAPLAQMWRISNDVWDVWRSAGGWPVAVESQFRTAAQWAPLARPGAWPDADMLPLGQLRPYPDVGPGPRATRLTPDEQRSQMALWCFARSPLILGANLTLLDDSTEKLVTNPTLLEVDQHARNSGQVWQAGALLAWRAELPGGRFAVALFNIGDTPATAAPSLSQLQLAPGSYDAIDAWTGGHSRLSALSAALPPHAVAVWMLQRLP